MLYKCQLCSSINDVRICIPHHIEDDPKDNSQVVWVCYNCRQTSGYVISKVSRFGYCNYVETLSIDMIMKLREK